MSIQSIPGGSTAKQFRTNLTIHRSAVTAVDKLAIPTAVTVADVATGGSLLAATTYNCTLAAGNALGSTTVPTVGAVTTASDASATHVARVTTTQVTNAAWYDLFLTTAAAPLWVARITEAQRAAGCTVTAVGTVSATSPGANKVDIRVVGTGVASTAAPFGFNNAYDITGITPIPCDGYVVANTNIKLTCTDLRSAPTLAYVILGQIQQDPTSLILIANVSVSLLTALRTPLQGTSANNIFGCTNLYVLIDTISGQGASCDVYVDLC